MSGDPTRPLRSFHALALEDYLVLGAAALLPWAFGGVEIWAHRTVALVLAAAAAVALFRHGWDGLGLSRRSRWLLPAGLLAVWALVQLMPIPPVALHAVSPSADALYAETFPGYPGSPDGSVPHAIEERALARVPEATVPVEVERPLGFEPRVGGRYSGWRTISLHPAAGQERAFWYIALLLGFLVARRRTSDPVVAELYRNALFMVFFLLAAFGLLHAATSNGKVYWIRAPMYPARVFGPYVNPTNFGALMELAVPWLAGYTVLAWRQRSPSRPLRESRVPFFAAATVTCLLAGLATASKAAAALIGLALAALVLWIARGARQRIAVAGGLALVGLTLFVALQVLPLGQRVREFVAETGGDVSQVDRVVAWRASMAMAGDYPVTGVGFGALPDAFGRYLPAGEAKRWEHAHNDYLEVLLEGGAVAALLVLWLTVAFWRRAARGVGGGRADPAAVGLLLGLAAMSIHAFGDFNHQIPSDALLFVVGAALLVARGEADVERGS